MVKRALFVAAVVLTVLFAGFASAQEEDPQGGQLAKQLEEELKKLGKAFKKLQEESEKLLGDEGIEKLRKAFEKLVESEELQKALEKLLNDEKLKKLQKEFEKLLEGEAVEKLGKEIEKILKGEDIKKLREELKKVLGEKTKELEKELEKALEKEMEKFEEFQKKIEKEFEKLFGPGEDEKKQDDIEPPEGKELDRAIDRMFEELKRRFEARDKIEKFRKKIKKLLDETFGKPEEKKVEPPDKTKPYVGVRLAEVDEVLQHHLGIEGGLVIEEVKDDSPAIGAGLKKDDIIIRAGGREIASLEDFARALEGKQPGDVLRLTLVARGKEVEVELKLGAWKGR